MNRRDHVVNAVLLSVGLGYLSNPAGGPDTAEAIVRITIPVVLGALFPDVDSVVGAHRKTFHNLPVLVAFYLFPAYFDNLHYVWLGIASHYVLDLLGTKRGLALFYPFRTEISAPVGVPVNSAFATVVTIVVTVGQLAVAGMIVHADTVTAAVTALR